MAALECLREIVAVSGPRVITAAHTAAATAGANAFAAGGNAFDAVLAACFMETVALPMKAGLFGDLVALLRVGGGDWTSLVSVGAGPLALASGATLERVGPRSVGVPGAPHGYATLQRHARLELSRLVQPAVQASRAGMPWSRVARSYVVEAITTLEKYSPNNPYAPRGRIPEVGEIRKLPGLGDLLLAFAERGASLFTGALAERIVGELQRRGGILVKEDLAQQPARLAPPASRTVTQDVTMMTTSAPTQGERLMAVVEEHLASGRSLTGIVRADRLDAQKRGRLATDEGTSVVAAADDEGNAVVVLHSNSFPQFASGIVMDDGLILNNRPGRGFDLGAPPEAANAPRAGKVPPTTLHAWYLQCGSQTFLGATPGGVNQLPWNAQTVTELVRGKSPGTAVSSPRWALDAGGVLSFEDSVKRDDEAGPFEVRADLSMRSVQQIIRLSDEGLHEAAADPRAGGTALAVF